MIDKLKMADMGGWRAEYDGLGSSAAHAIANSEGEVVAIAVTRGGGFHPPEVAPIAQRIVACWNACTGIPTEQLESDFAQGYEPWGHVQHLRAQRDALLGAVERLTNSFPTDSDMHAAGWEQWHIDEACNAYDAARALLKKITDAA